MHVTVGPEVYVEPVHDEVVLLELASGRYYGLDPVAARLWQLLCELGTTEAVVERALGEFEVDREVLVRDVEDLVRQLAQRGLVTTSC